MSNDEQLEEFEDQLPTRGKMIYKLKVDKVDIKFKETKPVELGDDEIEYVKKPKEIILNIKEIKDPRIKSKPAKKDDKDDETKFW